MELMRETWTDKRLDEFRVDVDHRFDRVEDQVRDLRGETRTEFIAMRGEMKDGFERMDRRFEKVDQRFEKIDERFESLHRLLLQLGAVGTAALIGLFATRI